MISPEIPDYSSYSITELREALASVNKDEFPERYREIEKQIKLSLNPEKSKNPVIDIKKQEKDFIQDYKVEILNIWFRRFLSFLQIGGGYIGYISIFQVLQTMEMNVFTIFLTLIAFCLFTFGIYTGLILLEGNSKAIDLTKLNLMIQVPYVTSPIISYSFFSGAYVTISVGIFNLNFNYLVGSSWHFSFFSDKNFSLGFNIIAVILFIIIHRITDKVDKMPDQIL